VNNEKLTEKEKRYKKTKGERKLDGRDRRKWEESKMDRGCVRRQRGWCE